MPFSKIGLNFRNGYDVLQFPQETVGTLIMKNLPITIYFFSSSFSLTIQSIVTKIHALSLLWKSSTLKIYIIAGCPIVCLYRYYSYWKCFNEIIFGKPWPIRKMILTKHSEILLQKQNTKNKFDFRSKCTRLHKFDFDFASHNFAISRKF